MTVRTIRFLSLASVGGADQTALRISGQRGDVYWRQGWFRCRGIMRGNPGLDLAYTCERAVPSQLQFRRDQPVLRLAHSPVGLPPTPTGMVGRDETVQLVSEELIARRFLTIVGPG